MVGQRSNGIDVTLEAPRVSRGPTKLAHLPALDGLRGVAVVGVLAFHGGFAAFKGGFLGVSIFFTLSGFLITSLLLREHAATGTISLRAFWSRRFRRLMPAALVGLAVACAYGAWFGSPEQLARLRTDVLAALGYMANWRFVLEHKRYADLFAAPSPVQHFWSLAIEEQFYIVYPLLVVVVLRRGGRRALVAVLAAMAAASLGLSFALASSFDRVYYGTDTRAFELLAGGLFALWWALPASSGPARIPSRVRDALGAIALVCSVAAWATVGQTSSRLPRGGFALQAVATVLMLVAITTPGMVGTVLSWAPLRATGLVSYGLYVYHWPVYLVLTTERTGLARLPVFALRIGATVALAMLSYKLIEQPIRRGRVLHGWSVRLAAPAAVMALVVAAIAVTWNPPASTVAYANADPNDFAPRVVELTPPSTSAPPTSPTSVAATPTSSTTTPLVVTKTVMVIGDSGMLDLQPALAAAYAATGVQRIVYASGPGFGIARSGFDWRGVWPKLIEDNRPEVVIVMLGGWDLPWLRSNGNDAYASIVEEVVRVLGAKGARVEWVAMLPGGATPDRPVDAIYEKVAAGHPEVVDYFDPEAVLRTGDPGTYGRVLGTGGVRLLLRKPDVWHLCPAGAERVATAIVERTAVRGWSLPEVSGWQQGSWRENAAFKDPVGGCDPRSVGADQ